MLASFLRFLCTLVGVILAAVSILGTVVAGSVVAAMAYAFCTEPRLSEHDASLWRWAAGIFVVGLPLSWASLRLANYGRSAHQAARWLPSSPQQRERQERWAPVCLTTLGLVMTACWAWGRGHGEPSARAWQAVSGATGYFLLLHASLLWHEVGHAVAAQLAGMEPLGIRLGSGPVVWRRVSARGFVWEWRWWPSWGYAVAVDRREQPAAWRFFVFIAGGPLLGGLFVALALFGLYRWGASGTTSFVRAGWSGNDWPLLLYPLYCLIVPAVVTLWPYTMLREGQILFTDGWWLLHVFSFPVEHRREMAGATALAHLLRLRELDCHPQAQAEAEYILKRFPERRALLTLAESRWRHQRLQHLQAETSFRQALEEAGSLDASVRVLVFAQHAAFLAVLDGADAARACCEATLAQVAEAERVKQLDAFACIPIYHRAAGALLPDAERRCREALEWSPDEITLRGTLGALRFEQGATEEAVTILREVLAATQSDEDRGMASFYLALAASRHGRRREMVSLRTQALRWCRVPEMLGRIHAELRPG